MKQVTKIIVALFLIQVIISKVGFSQTMVSQGLMYLVQPTPTTNPLRFPPENLLATSESRWHSAPAFSAKGDEMYYTMADNQTGQRMYYSKVVNGIWTESLRAPFANEDNESNPQFSHDGQSIYFMSQKTIDNNVRKWIYVSKREGDGWSEPEKVNIPLSEGVVFGNQFTLSNDFCFYFELWVNGATDLYTSKLVDGKYSSPSKIENMNSKSHDYCPFVDPNGAYLIFASMRAGGFGGVDLYVSFHKEDGSWGSPINLGEEINSSGHELFPLVSNDGMYFFFNAKKELDQGSNPYWVDASFIEELRPKD